MNDICYYDAATKTLSGSILSKARRFNKLHRIIYAGKGLYRIRHIPGYNTTDYYVDLNKPSCTCQQNTIKGKICSHILAASLHKKNHEAKK